MSIDHSARSGGRIGIFSIFFNMKISCVFALESPHGGNSNEYTRHTNVIIKIFLITSNITMCATIMDFFPKD